VDKEVQGGVQMTNFSKELQSFQVSIVQGYINILQLLCVEDDSDFELMRYTFFIAANPVPREHMDRLAAVKKGKVSYCIIGSLYQSSLEAKTTRNYRSQIVDHMILYFKEQKKMLSM
jgi:hypothetical protein